MKHERCAVPALGAAILLAGFAMPAWADAEARMRLSDFTIHLVDLDPDDGQGPSVRFKDTNRGDSTIATAFVVVEARTPIDLNEQKTSDRMYAPMAVSVTTARGQSFAEVVGRGPGAGTGFSAGGSLVGSARMPSARIAGGATLVNGFDTFELGAGTGMTITAQVDLYGKTTIGAKVLGNGNRYSEKVHMRAVLALAELPYGSGQRSSDSLALSVEALVLNPGSTHPVYTGRTLATSRLLTASISNRTDTSMTGQMDLRGGFDASVTSAVPGPGGPLPWLAGVAVVAAATGRHRRPSGRGAQRA